MGIENMWGRLLEKSFSHAPFKNLEIAKMTLAKKQGFSFWGKIHSRHTGVRSGVYKPIHGGGAWGRG